MHQRLADGSRVCIVGGGPAGSFAALHLLHEAGRRGLRVEVLIFEPRDFTRPGPAGCNRCAGILSARLVAGLESLGLALPAELVQADVQSYAVHLQGATVRVERPDPQRRILSVYRGSGPRHLQGSAPQSFDAFLLAQAAARGAAVITGRVKQVAWEDGPVVYAAAPGEAGEARYPADLLVLANGVNSRSPLAPGFGYMPPLTEVMAQNEVLRPPDWPGDQVDVFFGQQPGVLFGALIPKGGYLNVSLLGQNLHLETVQDFLVAQKLAPPSATAASATAASATAASEQVSAAAHRPGVVHGGLCGCTPRVAVQPARCFFGDRWVAVGDAAVTRLYKDGIGSAFYTAQAAMQVALDRGIMKADFAGAYAAYCRGIASDNRFGRALFRLWALTLRTPALLDAWLNAIRGEASLPPGRRVHQRVLWGMFTGAERYRTLFWLAVSPQATAAVLRSWGRRK